MVLIILIRIRHICSKRMMARIGATFCQGKKYRAVPTTDKKPLTAEKSMDISITGSLSRILSRKLKTMSSSLSVIIDQSSFLVARSTEAVVMELPAMISGIRLYMCQSQTAQMMPAMMLSTMGL